MPVTRGAPEIAVGVTGGVVLLYGAAAGIYVAIGHYANGCGHGVLVGVGAAIGAACALTVAAVFVAMRRRPPTWLATSVLVLILPVVGSTALISNDDLSAGGCQYAHHASTEDSVGVGWMTFAGGIALAAALIRKKQ